MGELFLLSECQMARIAPHFPLAHGVPRVDDRRVVSGIVYVIRNGLQWKDAPPGYGPHKTLYNRFIRWSRLGVFNRIFASLAGEGPRPERIMIDATHLKAHRTAASLLKGGMFPAIGRTKGGLNSKLHAVCDGQGRPLVMTLTEGQTSDYKGARLMLPHLPPVRELLADKGYDADWLREALTERDIAVCIPSRAKRRNPVPHDATLYKQRHKIEVMFGRLKDWRRIATRYDRCAHTFFSAICIAAAVTFWL
ncbi:IS5 family transposase [Jeongeupella avenae]|uniref:IS5 family transposase n=1 Tax=Antarcticirhabdus aurantiaca TaxID=2606717 RepID=A0ACD4NP00_9HYPH|nr:IS5 family transposase [Antarcticirhabdus aurantiaca]WAJ28474.1 IS5 family transposase [Jeongeuplla avenae]